jgi:hypothetical protein
MTYVAYFIASTVIPFEDVPVPNGPWEDSGEFLAKELGAPIETRSELFFFHSLLTGVRSPDTNGGSALNLASIRAVHLEQGGQYAHCLRDLRDDDLEGNKVAVTGCRDSIIADLETAKEFAQKPMDEQIIFVDFSADFYGKFEIRVWAPAYFLGRAIHAMEDSFTHMLRTENRRSIIHVMNFTEAITGNLHEPRDGMAHSNSMDICEGVTQPLVESAVEASADLIRAFSAELADPDGEEIELITLKWITYTRGEDLGYEEGCIQANDYCDSPWTDIARESPTDPVLCSVDRIDTPVAPLPWSHWLRRR